MFAVDVILWHGDTVDEPSKRDDKTYSDNLGLRFYLHMHAGLRYMRPLPWVTQTQAIPEDQSSLL